jgi:hypothetical protein
MNPQETRTVPLALLTEMSAFLQSEFPMAKVRQAVESLEFFMREQPKPVEPELEAPEE